MRSRALLAICTVVGIVALAAGCGGSSAKPSASTRPSTPTTPDSPATTAPATTTTTAVRGGPPAVPSTGAYFGTWRGPGPGRSTDPHTTIEDAEREIGRRYAIDHQYYDWDAPIPTAYERWTAARGRIPMVSLCACRFKDGSNVQWGAIASGQYDLYLVSIARGFKSLGSPAFFVFESEPEAQVGIRGTATEYRAAFRHVVSVFRSQRVKNVAFVWATTAYAFRPEAKQLALVESLYPGDDVVDWIASDPYNFDQDGVWNSLAFELGPWYAWAVANHPGKPLALTEWGSKEDPNNPARKAEWFADALTGLSTKYRAIKAVVYFDEQKYERGVVNDWRIDTSAASLAAFAKIGRAAWFRTVP